MACGRLECLVVRSGGPRPTEERVAAKRRELEAALQQAGVPVAPSARTKLYQYYVSGPLAAALFV